MDSRLNGSSPTEFGSRAGPGSAAAADELEEIVAAYEIAWANGREPAPEDYVPDPSHRHYVEIACDLIRLDMQLNWAHGRLTTAESYRDRFPAVFSDARASDRIRFEELRLRLQHGDQPGYDSEWLGAPPTQRIEPARSVPAGSGFDAPKVVRVAKDRAGPGNTVTPPPATTRGPDESPRSYGPGPAAPDFSKLGTDFLGFQLIELLGVGSFANVYLARQGELADRCVTLKVSAIASGEPQTLAQLQHTNIVPIFSVHRSESFQAVCMPYLGSTTLKDLLDDFRRQGALPSSGQDLLSSLEAHSRKAAGDAAAASDSPVHAVQWRDLAPSTRRIMARLSYVQAVLSIGARLADGLAHAHDRGILHCDLKPANVLLTDDGQPMLLDFNLSTDLKRIGHRSLGAVGGTVLYMAPEHLAAHIDKTTPIDARSDIYSLGLILYELLTGQYPFPIRKGRLRAVIPQIRADRQRPVPPARRWNDAITPAVESILRHCLEQDPERRYQSAAELLEDLNRQTEHRPLRYAPDPSPRERLAKWVHRHPKLSSAAGVGSVLLAVVAALAGAAVVGWHQHEQFVARETWERFEQELETAQFLLYGRSADVDHLDRAIAECGNALARYRVLDDPDWQRSRAVQALPERDRQRLRDQVGELLFLAARATWLRAQSGPVMPSGAGAARALGYNDAALGCYEADSAPRALWLQRGELLAALGRKAEADECLARARQTPLQGARDLYLMAQQYGRSGQFHQALPLLDQALEKEPSDFSAWFVKGNCHEALLQYAQAEASYSVCIGLKPDFHWAWFNRGWSRVRQKHFEAALADFGHVIEQHADLADAYIDRSVAYQGLGRYSEAAADLTRALELGTRRTRVYFLRAAAREKAGDRAGSRRDREEGLRRTPTDEDDWVARGLARLAANPAGALADFDQALQRNSLSLPALQNKAHVLGEWLGKDREAVAVLDGAVAAYPETAALRAGRGVHRARLGDDEGALADAEAALLLDTDPPNIYQVACIYALTASRHPEHRLRAYQLLSRALRGGFGLDVVDRDPDLKAIRDGKEYRDLVAAARTLRSGNGKDGP